MKHTIVLLAVPLLLLLVSACDTSSGTDDPAPGERRNLTVAEKAVVAADNRFGFELFDALTTELPADNVFISPLSVSMALGMTANGAAGQTYDEMIAMLGKANLDPEAVNQSYHDLTELLTALDPTVAVTIANSIWYREGYPVLPGFLEAGQIWFDAEIAALDFTDPASVGRINGWVDDRTNGLIDEVITSIEPGVVMYLINAIYFKGTWQYRFDRDETVDAPFHNVDGTTTTVPLMTLEAELPVLRTDRFSAFDLAYGDSLYSMTVLLPNEGVTAAGLAAEMDGDAWYAWASQFQRTKMRIHLPRFQAEYKGSLKPALIALGMPTAFAPGAADFSRLTEGGGPWIDDVLHEAVVDVNEDGTEAAAVTTVIIIETSIGPQIRVDRPFLFLIRERHTGTVLFLGMINVL